MTNKAKKEKELEKKVCALFSNKLMQKNIVFQISPIQLISATVRVTGDKG
jgi:hypothetical protein